MSGLPIAPKSRIGGSPKIKSPNRERRSHGQQDHLAQGKEGRGDHFGDLRRRPGRARASAGAGPSQQKSFRLALWRPARRRKTVQNLRTVWYRHFLVCAWRGGGEAPVLVGRRL